MKTIPKRIKKKLDFYSQKRQDKTAETHLPLFPAGHHNFQPTKEIPKALKEKKKHTMTNIQRERQNGEKRQVNRDKTPSVYLLATEHQNFSQSFHLI